MTVQQGSIKFVVSTRGYVSHRNFTNSFDEIKFLNMVVFAPIGIGTFKTALNYCVWEKKNRLYNKIKTVI